MHSDTKRKHCPFILFSLLSQLFLTLSWARCRRRQSYYQWIAIYKWHLNKSGIIMLHDWFEIWVFLQVQAHCFWFFVFFFNGNEMQRRVTFCASLHDCISPDFGEMPLENQGHHWQIWGFYGRVASGRKALVLEWEWRKITKRRLRVKTGKLRKRELLGVEWLGLTISTHCLSQEFCTQCHKPWLHPVPGWACPAVLQEECLPSVLAECRKQCTGDHASVAVMFFGKAGSTY